MREQNYGRIVLTTSGSALYGNFGQANYGAAKAAMVGLMNVLAAEGQKNDIRVNALAPTAAARMTAGILEPQTASLMAPEAITPAVLMLVCQDAPSRMILAAGAGCYAVTRILETEGIYLPESERTPEAIEARLAQMTDMAGAHLIGSAFEQTDRYVRKAAAASGIQLSG
jgi:NAD(P)-dependent dehydrogenase (short-subunit alcohol dehydrogenase family)